MSSPDDSQLGRNGGRVGSWEGKVNPSVKITKPLTRNTYSARVTTLTYGVYNLRKPGRRTYQKKVCNGGRVKAISREIGVLKTRPTQVNNGVW